MIGWLDIAVERDPVHNDASFGGSGAAAEPSAREIH